MCFHFSYRFGALAAKFRQKSLRQIIREYGYESNANSAFVLPQEAGKKKVADSSTPLSRLRGKIHRERHKIHALVTLPQTTEEKRRRFDEGVRKTGERDKIGGKRGEEGGGGEGGGGGGGEGGGEGDDDYADIPGIGNGAKSGIALT